MVWEVGSVDLQSIHRNLSLSHNTAGKAGLTFNHSAEGKERRINPSAAWPASLASRCHPDSVRDTISKDKEKDN